MPLRHGLAGRFSPTLTEFSHQGVPGSVEMTTGTNGVIRSNLQWGQTPYRYICGLNCQSEGLATFGGTGGGVVNVRTTPVRGYGYAAFSRGIATLTPGYKESYPLRGCPEAARRLQVASAVLFVNSRDIYVAAGGPLV